MSIKGQNLCTAAQKHGLETEEPAAVKARAKYTDGFIEKVDEQSTCLPCRSTYM